jgi:hypothetical protein
MVNGFRISQLIEVDRLYGDMAKDQVERPVALGGPERDLLADQRLGSLHASSAEAQPSGAVDPARNVRPEAEIADATCGTISNC